MIKKIVIACLLAAPIMSSAQVLNVSDTAENTCSAVAETYLGVAIDRGNDISKIIEKGNVVAYNPDYSYKQVASMFEYIDYMYDHPEMKASDLSSHGYWNCVRNFNKVWK